MDVFSSSGDRPTVGVSSHKTSFLSPTSFFIANWSANPSSWREFNVLHLNHPLHEWTQVLPLQWISCFCALLLGTAQPFLTPSFATPVLVCFFLPVISWDVDECGPTSEPSGSPIGSNMPGWNVLSVCHCPLLADIFHYLWQSFLQAILKN